MSASEPGLVETEWASVLGEEEEVPARWWRRGGRLGMPEWRGPWQGLARGHPSAVARGQ